MALIVQKYGGTSVATPDKVIEAARQIRAAREDGNQVASVLPLKLKKATVASPAMMPTRAPVRLANGTCGNANTTSGKSCVTRL